MTGKVLCLRCNTETVVNGSNKHYISKYCENCRTKEELALDLGCAVCDPLQPLCLTVPSGFDCPGGIF